MKVLLTNDDGIHAGGITEIARIANERAELYMIAPRTEQSGISRAITFLRPIFPEPLKNGFDGHSVDGTPTDCVKLGLYDLCPWTPDVVVSGINGGLNAGANVGYSGTVAGALAGASFGLRAIAVSLEFSDQMDYARAAEIAWPMIERFVAIDLPDHTVININIPTAALSGNAETVVVPVESNLLGFHFDKGVDPKGREYFWSNNKPAPKPSPFETDCQALAAGKITVSTISYDMNEPNAVPAIEAALEQVKK